MTSALSYELRLTWNGATVLLAATSQVVCDYVITAHFNGSFAGRDFQAWSARHTHNLIERMLRGERIALEWSDDTGAATAQANPL